jgi:hypothetical protein
VRKSFLIVFFIHCFQLAILAQPEIRIECADSWGPGRYNLVTVRISFGTNDGFARFTQDFPVGFEIIKDKITEGDFEVTSDQLNVVWMKIPDDKTVEFSYYIRPDKLMGGNIDVNARIVIITGGTKKETFAMKEIPVKIGGVNGFFPAELSERSAPENVTNVTNPDLQNKDVQSEGTLFRVQVSSSSSEETEEVIRKNLGLGKEIKITTVRAGRIYKYQAGEYADYASAVRLQKTLIGKGIKDAFVVAYRQGIQISLEEARDVTGKNR